jgi:hypothetical protein
LAVENQTVLAPVDGLFSRAGQVVASFQPGLVLPMLEICYPDGKPFCLIHPDGVGRPAPFA